MPDLSLGKAVLELTTDDKGLDKGIADAEQKATKLGGTFGKISGVGKVMAGVVGGTVVGALSDFSRAAIDDEANVAKLRQAVENSGASWDDNVGAIEDRIKKSQDLAVSDTDTRDSIAQLTASLGSVTKAVDAQNEILDIARGRSISVAAATDIYQKAALGNYGALKRMGIEIDAAMTPTQALGELQKRYAGQAETYGNSTKGSIDKIKDSLSEFTEGIGHTLGPAQGLIAMLPGLGDGMSLAGGAVGGLSKIINITGIPSLLAMAVPFAPVLLAIAAIGTAVFLLKMAWDNDWGGIREKTAGALEFLGGVFDGFKGFIAGWGLGIIGIIRGVINIVVGILNTLIDGWNAIAEKLHLPIIGKIQVELPGLDAAESALRELARPRSTTLTVYEQAIQGGGGVKAYAAGTDHIATSPELFFAGETAPRPVTKTAKLSRPRTTPPSTTAPRPGRERLMPMTAAS